jgi:hypothetical protein
LGDLLPSNGSPNVDCVTSRMSLLKRCLTMVYSVTIISVFIDNFLISYPFAVHRCTSTKILSLHYTFPGDGLIAVSLQLQITYEVSFSSLIPVLSLFCSCQFRRLDSSLSTTVLYSVAEQSRAKSKSKSKSHCD